MSGQAAETTTVVTEGALTRIPSHGRGRLAPLWEKGKSPNPGGMGVSIYHEARKLCAEHTPEAIRKQIELMRTCDDARVVALITDKIIERGAGKVRDHSNEQPQHKIDLTALSQEERNAMAALLMKVMGL